MKPLGPTARLRRYLSAKEFGVIFSTRDCLHLGRRSALDQALYRMVKSGDLIRLARGVFMKADAGAVPSIATIAVYKAQAFHRIVHRTGRQAYATLTKTANRTDTVGCDGDTSSFMVLGQQRIRLKHYCPRKLELGDSKTGMLVRGLWDVGEENLTNEIVEKAVKAMTRSQFDALPRACRIMPAWLANRLVWSRPRFDTLPSGKLPELG